MSSHGRKTGVVQAPAINRTVLGAGEFTRRGNGLAVPQRFEEFRRLEKGGHEADRPGLTESSTIQITAPKCAESAEN